MSVDLETEVTRWFREHGGLVRSTARSFATDPDDLDDLFQDIWVIVVRKFHDAPPETKIRSWLFSITVNTGLGRQRKRERRKGLFAEQMGGQQEAVVPEQMGSIEEHMRIRDLWRSIEALPPLQKAVVMLRVVDGYKTAEAAILLNRAEGTVKASLHRALGKLRGRFQFLGTDEPRVH